MNNKPLINFGIIFLCLPQVKLILTPYINSQQLLPNLPPFNALQTPTILSVHVSVTSFVLL